jgi:hypothetical protein
VIEEAYCEAYEQLSPGERVYWEVVFSQRESSTSYEALRITDLACCQDSEREVKKPMDCSCEGVYSRVEQVCGE